MMETEGDVKILPPIDMTTEGKKLTVIFKMFCQEEIKITHME